MKDYIYHHGIKGMKWGIRRFQNEDGSLTIEGKERYGKERSSGASSRSSKKRIEDLTNDELRKINERLQLEKQNLELIKQLTELQQTKRGKGIVGKMFSKSADNIGTQAMTYFMGKALNTLFGEEIVNPKKGQKDK